MPHIHPNARTTPAVCAEIAGSTKPSGIVARRYGISAETVRKWRKRGAADCLDHSARPHRLPWKATDEERAVVCALRQATNSALDDLTLWEWGFRGGAYPKMDAHHDAGAASGQDGP